MSIVLVEYNAGNVRSVRYALERLGISPTLSSDPGIISKADKVIFPGVGEARSTMSFLRMRGLDRILAELKQPVLGICLGLQLLCSHSEENDTECVGVFKHSVKKFNPDRVHGVKVPHMGWNNADALRGPLFDGIEQGAHFYFVHSFYAELGQSTVAEATHGVRFSAALSCGNFHAVQFHPEKSGATGEKLLRNFLNL